MKTSDQVKIVREGLKMFGFTAASRDCDAQNFRRYAPWLVQNLRSKVRLINPTTREVTIDETMQDRANRMEEILTQAGVL